MASQGQASRSAFPPPTTWIYRDGAVIQGSENGPVLILPVDSIQDQSLVIHNENRQAVEYQCQESTTLAVVIDSKGDQYTGSLTCGDYGDTVSLKIINKDTGKTALVTFRNYQQITQDLSHNKMRILTNQQGKLSYSYRTSELSWKCLGEAQVYDGNRIVIQTYAAIQSCVDKQLQSRVKIVTGVLGRGDRSPRRLSYGRPMLASMSRMSAEGLNPADSDEEASTNADMIVHDVGVKVLSGLTKLPLSESAILEGSKVYFHKTSDQNLTYAGYRVTVKDVVPACQLTVNQVYDDGSKVLGVIDIKEHRAGAVLDLKLSASTAVRVETVVVTVEDKPAQEGVAQSLGIIPTKVWHAITDLINVKLTNNTNVRQTVILSHFLGDNILMETSLQHGQFRYVDQCLEVPIAVEPPANPGDSVVIPITITTGRLTDK